MISGALLSYLVSNYLSTVALVIWLILFEFSALTREFVFKRMQMLILWEDS